MTDYNDGQIWGWNGGDCPVHPETVVEYWMQICAGSARGDAGGLLWDHSKSPGDIIAFRVVKQYVEPKVLWVNEYTSGNAVFTSEEAAKKQAMTWVTRIAVKYQEVKDD